MNNLKEVYEELDGNLEKYTTDSFRGGLLANLKQLVESVENVKLKSIEDNLIGVCDFYDYDYCITNDMGNKYIEIEISKKLEKDEDGLRIVTTDYLFNIFPDMTAFAIDEDGSQYIYYCEEAPFVDEDDDVWDIEDGNSVDLDDLNFKVEFDGDWKDSLVLRNGKKEEEPKEDIHENDDYTYDYENDICTYYNNDTLNGSIECDFNNLKTEIDYHIFDLVLCNDMYENGYEEKSNSFLWKFVKDMTNSDSLCVYYENVASEKNDICLNCCVCDDYCATVNKYGERYNVVKEKLDNLIKEDKPSDIGNDVNEYVKKLEDIRSKYDTPCEDFLKEVLTEQMVLIEKLTKE